MGHRWKLLLISIILLEIPSPWQPKFSLIFAAAKAEKNYFYSYFGKVGGEEFDVKSRAQCTTTWEFCRFSCQSVKAKAGIALTFQLKGANGIRRHKRGRLFHVTAQHSWEIFLRSQMWVSPVFVSTVHFLKNLNEHDNASKAQPSMKRLGNA